MFQSPAPDDIWAGKYHRVNGEWVLPFRMSGNLVWVASPTEVWTLETNTSLLHVWTPSGQTVMDLSRPARAYTALRDGWIAYYEPRTDGCVVCDGNIGFVRATASDFVDVPVPAARWSVTTILENVAVTERGEVLSWDGTAWSITDALSGGPTSMSHYGSLSGTSNRDLYVVGGLHSYHFDGQAWTELLINGFRATDVWARPFGPVWATSWLNESSFEWDGSTWADRGPIPAGIYSIGSDGTNVFAAAAGGIYRFLR